MKLCRVQIKNVLGIEEVDFEVAEDVTIVAGDNGTGKTSVLESVCAALIGGGRELLRRGADEGSVYMLIDEDIEVERSFSVKKGTELKVETGRGKEGAAKEYLDKLTRVLSVRPVDFIEGTDKDRLDYLLHTIPAKLPPAFADTARELLPGIKPKELEGHPVVVADGIRKKLYDERTVVNRQVTQRRSAEEQFRKALPPRPPASTNWDREIERLEKERQSADSNYRALDQALDQALREGRRELQQQFLDRKAEIELEAREKIEAAMKERDDQIETVEEDARKARAARMPPLQTEITTRAEALASARGSRDEWIRAESQFQLADSMTAEIEGYENRSRELTEAIDRIDAFKGNLLKRLPVEGLEIIDGVVYRGGVPWRQINTAQQIDIALDLAEAGAGKLGIICADGLERMTPHNRAELLNRVRGRGLQFIIAVAEEHWPLTISSLDSYLEEKRKRGQAA